MDFFGRQRITRSRTRLLLLGFAAALLAMAAASHVAIAALSLVLGDGTSLVRPSAPAAALIGILWTTVLLGALFRWLDVRGGGAALAGKLGAVRVPENATDAHEARLLRAVAEVAIAASVSRPEVWVLPREPALNAFVAGGGDGPHALVVTSGALEAFDEASLRAVVAHEFGHIVHGDAILNMRLIVALGALSAIDEVGRLLTGEDESRRGRREVHPAMLVGYPLRLLGSLGTLMAGALRALVSQQREFAADASAVQFTRDPWAMAAALATVREAHGAAHDDAPLHVPHAARYAHLCFAVGDVARWRRAFSTHPTLDARIRAIEPHFEVKRRALARRADGGSRGRDRPAGPAVPFAATAPFAGPFTEAPEGTDVNTTGTSDRLMLLLPDERACLAALFLVFAPDEPLRRREWIDRLSITFDAGFARSVSALASSLAGELSSARLELVEHATTTLGASVHPGNRRRLLTKLEAAAHEAGRTDLASYATLRLIRRRLDVEFPTLERLGGANPGERTAADARGVRTFDRMGHEFALLLSLVVHSSGAEEAFLDAEFARVLACYTSEPLPRRRPDEPGIVAELEAAFQILYVQPRAIRDAFVAHCVEICQRDGRIVPEERSMLELIAASLAVGSDHDRVLKTG